MPIENRHYVKFKDHYLADIATVWHRHLENDNDLQSIYSSLPNDDERGLFLRVGAFYRYLVKDGNFSLSEARLNETMPYIDITYKFIAIFSLIEALETKAEYLDFYQWLQKQDPAQPDNRDESWISALEPLYRAYKDQYGSIRAAVTFFERLNEDDQELLATRLRIAGKSVPIKKLANILYDMRSTFVHTANFVLGFSSVTTASYYGNAILINDLTIADVCTLFEHGFLNRFGWKAPNKAIEGNSSR